MTSQHQKGARWALHLLCATALAACAAVAPPAAPPLTGIQSAAVAGAAAQPSAADRIRADVAYLADDARQGREAGTAAYEDAAQYVAARFADLGLAAGGEEGGWFQRVTLRLSRRNADASSMTIAKEGGAPVALAYLDDYISNTAPVERVEISGPAVFVGYGVTDPETDYDDYAGVDATGKIVVMFAGAPKHLDSEKAAHLNGNSAKTENAAKHGAIGVITLPTDASEKRFPWERVKGFASNPSTTWVHPDGRPETASDAIKAGAFMSAEGAKKLFAGAAQSYEALRAIEADPKQKLAAFDLPVSVTIAGGATYEDTSSSNVVGLIPGADPKLKSEFVVLSAHLDHVGVRTPEPGSLDADNIRNGALDNAMGVATLIEAARMFKEAGAPPRTIVFLAVTAEEKGLLGADYFAHYPTVAKDGIVANVNLDMPLVLFDFVDVIAFGAERSTLGGLVAAAAQSMGVALIPDPVPEQGLFTRSDHYRFVEQGVPSVFLVVGFGNGGKEIFESFLKDHYHKPSDDTSLPIDYQAAAKFADLNYRIAKAIADAPERPRWNEGDFFGDLFGK